MEEVSKIQNDILVSGPRTTVKKPVQWMGYLPILLVIVGAFAVLGLRIEIGPRFVSDGALMMLALACYILAALFQLTNLYAPSGMDTTPTITILGTKLFNIIYSRSFLK